MAFEPEDFAGKVLRLHSPASQGILEISWPLKEDSEIYQARIKELLDTIKFVCDDFKQLHMGLKSYTFEFEEKKSFKNAQTLVDRFNKSVQLYIKMNKGTQDFYARCQRKASSSLLDHILKQVYRQSITDPQKLNDYKSFTSETYGETNYQQMERIIGELEWDENDVFVDLGSGIGSIAMQVASATGVSRAVGIEIQPNPNKCAAQMDEHFRKMMRWYGKIFNHYELYDGNFLDKTYRDVRTNKNTEFDWRADATIIFVNNYAFAEDLNLKLKKIFGDMKPMTKIISTKAFCPVDFKINDRNAGIDIGCFMRVQELNSIQDGFSWTDKVVQVFLSVIDHSKLHTFYGQKNEKKNRGGGGGKDRSSSNSPIDFVPDAITRRPIKSASIKTPTTKLTPPHTIKKEIEKPRKQPGRGRPPSKVNKFMQDSNVKNAFEVFHKDQVNSHKNNHSVRQSIVSKTQIDDAWEKASEDWKKQFHDAVSTFLNMSQKRLDRLFEGERASLAKLDQMVKDEENKIAELRQSHTKRCRQSIATQCDIRDKKLVKREHEIIDEDQQIRLLQHQILGNQTRMRHTKHPNFNIKLENGAPNPVRPTIIKQPQYSMANGRKKETEGPPKFGSTFSNPMPSPHSIPQSPHSIKSSPSSDMKSSDPHTTALLDAGLQSQIVMSPRTEKEPLKQVENPANHFPINLTPTPTLQNSCESGNNSPSSSIYGSPRSKRQRLKSIDSDRSSGGTIHRPNQQSVIQASTATVQTSTSSTPRHKNTSHQSHIVPQPQHLMVHQPTVLNLNPGVLSNQIINRQPGVNGHLTHGTVIRQRHRADGDSNDTKPIEQQHAHLFGGLHNGFIQNPAAPPNTHPNNTDVNKDLKEKKLQASQQTIPAISVPIELTHGLTRLNPNMTGVPGPFQLHNVYQNFQIPYHQYHQLQFLQGQVPPMPTRAPVGIQPPPPSKKSEK